jgi:hypothetical protein
VDCLLLPFSWSLFPAAVGRVRAEEAAEVLVAIQNRSRDDRISQQEVAMAAALDVGEGRAGGVALERDRER